MASVSGKTFVNKTFKHTVLLVIDLSHHTFFIFSQSCSVDTNTAEETVSCY